MELITRNCSRSLIQICKKSATTTTVNGFQRIQMEKKQHRFPARCVGWCKQTNTSYQIVVHLQAYPDTLKDTTMFLEY